MDNKKNIILIGMMGAGKSVLGHLLDEKLADFSYVDIDKEIEKEAGKSIKEIFVQNGEEHFRRLESKIIKKFCTYHNQVISTGGGIVEKTENIDTMKKNGVLFYLKAHPKTLLERIKDSTHRPMLFGHDPMERINQLMEKREQLYKMADYEIQTDRRELLDIANEILEKYNNDNQSNQSDN